MVIKKDLIIAVLATFCLTFALFSTISTRGSPAREYDPMADLTGPEGVPDGVINMRDIGYVCNLFGATGTPINWTKLFEDVNELQSKVNALESRIPKKGYISISPTAFTPYDELTSYSKWSEYMYGGGFFFAGVQLPNGATITNITACIRDQLSGPGYGISLTLYRTDMTSLGKAEMANVETGFYEAPGKVILHDDTINYAVIDHQNYTYSLELYISIKSFGNLEFYWALIEYEYPE